MTEITSENLARCVVRVDGQVVDPWCVRARPPAAQSSAAANGLRLDIDKSILEAELELSGCELHIGRPLDQFVRECLDQSEPLMEMFLSIIQRNNSSSRVPKKVFGMTLPSLPVRPRWEWVSTTRVLDGGFVVTIEGDALSLDRQRD